MHRKNGSKTRSAPLSAMAWPLFAAPVLASASCAFTTLTLPPPAHQTVSSIAAGAAQRGRGREIVLVFPFADQRPIRNRCGMKKNGFGSDTADILCATPPNDWLAQLLAQELRVAGFRVSDDAARASPAALRVEGILTQFFVEPKVGFFTYTPETDIEIALRATTASGLLAERRFYWKGREVSLVGTDSNFGLSMEHAVRQALGALASAIADLLDQFPQLASAGPLHIAARVAPSVEVLR